MTWSDAWTVAAWTLTLAGVGATVALTSGVAAPVLAALGLPWTMGGGVLAAASGGGAGASVGMAVGDAVNKRSERRGVVPSSSG